ncbi:efflux RND transporter periplasmic adaptor subunit [Actinoplanes flavus]|uniref:Efflux RND transporter periplasmic adaptor subunit n=1 Tax=Actinoplanes flavus TaxID=2820290 RepID=A0ABS3UHG8_9ACTN|nr:efflux RND transporter periplasmic adaptor subunit [Actinoplanes flavus]MBO3737641.1 efflux RND transporter periplasmic adaptor subunit [Actinoplanes flavus]
MKRRVCVMASAVVVLLGGCTSEGEQAQTPELEARGTVLTTVQPTRQDLVNQISLAGKVTINPTFGIVAPAEGELRFTDRQPTTVPVVRDTWVASVWDGGAPRRVYIPEGSIMAGRLMADKSPVSKGMPIISAKHVGYGIVADIDSAQAYRISGAVKSIKAQIKNGPGPFSCKPIGTIAALPAGTLPEPEPDPTTQPAANPSAPPVAKEEPAPDAGGATGSEPTGLQVVCVAPAKIKLINGSDVTLDVITGRSEDALVLPVEAVAGSQGKGKVDLVIGEERRRKTIDVTLGISDGKVIEIKKGLQGNETIAVPGPNLPTPAPGEVTG